MMTELTIKLHKIVNLANAYCKTIWSAYMRENVPANATKLCTLWGALNQRISHVHETTLIMEYGQKWWDYVTKTEKKIYHLPDPKVKKAYDSVAHIVDQIMFLAKKHVENNTLPDLNNWALAY